MDLKQSLKHISHHAYLLIGGESTRDDLISILEKGHKLSKQGNPDFFDKKFETFTIDDARELKSLAETLPVKAEGKKLFVLTMNGITVEAQNALLKLLEEPHEYVHFFLIIPSAHLLLPTVKSRLHPIGAAKNGKDADLSDAKRFLKLPPAKRLEEIKSLLDDISKEKRPRQDAVDFLNNIQAAVYSEKGTRNALPVLEAIETARRYVNDRAPSLKMLLEYVALNI